MFGKKKQEKNVSNCHTKNSTDMTSENKATKSVSNTSNSTSKNTANKSSNETKSCGGKCKTSNKTTKSCS